VELSPEHTCFGLLLLALLLLRADLPQRLAFLQGPWGGLLLAALQLYACGRTPLHEALQGVEPELLRRSSWGWWHGSDGSEGLVEILGRDDPRQHVQPSSVAARWLSWLLLQPVGSSVCCGGNSSNSSSSSSSSSGSSSGVPNGTNSSGEAWKPAPMLQLGSRGEHWLVNAQPAAQPA
jgi:hypothetical protein